MGEVDVGDDTPSPIARLRAAWSGVSDRMEDMSGYAHEAMKKPVTGFYSALHKSPGAVIIILLLGAASICSRKRFSK